MPALSEDQFSRWTKPAFGNESKRADRAKEIIRSAIAEDELLSTLAVAVYAKGSYKNNTNVRRDSDIDIAVEYTGMITSDYAPGADRRSIRARRGTSSYSGPFRDPSGSSDAALFKDAVGEALVAAFGPGPVIRSNKVFTIRESSRALAADVVPCIAYRRYFASERCRAGVRLLPDLPAGHRVLNYPVQHYRHGVIKNKATTKRFKPVVRILKSLESRMVDDGVSPQVPGYLIECLAYNCPRRCYEGSSWGRRLRGVLCHICAATESELTDDERWREVNGIKYLFHSNQKWTRPQAHAFATAARRYVGKA